MGRWRLNAGIFKRIFLVCRNDAYSLFSGNWRALRPMYPDRMFLLVVMNAASFPILGQFLTNQRPLPSILETSFS